MAAPIRLLDDIARASRNRVILGALVVAAGIGLLVANAAYLAAYFRGPVPITPASLQANPSLAGQPAWVKLEVRQLENTGMTEITVRKKRGVERSRSVSASYHAALLEGRGLLVKVDSEETPGKVLVGELQPLESGAAGALFQGPRAAELREFFLPLELHVHDYRSSGHWILLIAAVLLLGGAWYAWAGWSRRQAPITHPTARKAVQWGGVESVEAALRAEAPDALRLAGWTLGEHFLARSSLLDVEVHQLDDLLWAYMEVTKKKLYYVIPAGQTNAMVLKWRDATVKIDLKEDAVMEALQRIAAHQPWIVFGWSKEIQTLYERQRANFGAQVAQSRKHWLAQQQQAQSAPAPQQQGFEPTKPQALAEA